MTTTVVTIDFETKDPYINELNCSGWVFRDIKLLCVGVKINSEKTRVYDLRDDSQMKAFWELMYVCNTPDHIIVAHNAQYDMGCLEMLGILPTKATFVDTKILAFLDYNLRESNSLNALGEELLGESKTSDELYELIAECGDVLRITKATNLPKAAMSNMDLLYERYKDTVEKYCIQDVDLCYNLYVHFTEKNPKIDTELYSDLIKALIKARRRGVRVDLKRIEYVSEVLEDRQKAAEDRIRNEYTDANIRSTKQLAEVLDDLGISYPKTAKGNPSITSPWLKEQEHELCKLIVEAKKYEKANRDYCSKLAKIARNKSKCGRYGYVYPEFKIFGARTGRFSCSGPNIQQIPARDEEIGPLARSLFVPEEGEQWYSFDYSSQEPRLQIHYAEKLKAPGHEDFVHDFIADPNLDLHKKAAEVMFGSYSKENRFFAKTINLGMSYGMGAKKLAAQMGVSDAEAKSLSRRYNTMCPYLKFCTLKVENAGKSRGYVYSLARRKLYIEQGFEYKAYNAVIQGGALDQTMAAIVACYRADIPILFTVHDEIDASLPKGSTGEKLAEKIRRIMETIIPLEVPMVVEYNKGKNWGEAK